MHACVTWPILWWVHRPAWLSAAAANDDVGCCCAHNDPTSFFATCYPVDTILLCVYVCVCVPQNTMTHVQMP